MVRIVAIGCVLLGGLLVAPSAWAIPPSPYAIELVAEVDAPLGADAPTTLGRGPSINNRGDVAFTAALDSGRQAVLLATPDGLLEPSITANQFTYNGISQVNMVNQAFSFGHFVQVNDERQVLYRARANDGLLGFVIRVSTSPVAMKLVAKTYYPRPDFPALQAESPFQAAIWADGLQPGASLANTVGSASRSVFGGVLRPGLVDVALASPVDSETGGHDFSSDFYMSVVTGGAALYPMAADDGATVFRQGGASTSPLLWLNDPTFCCGAYIAQAPEWVAIGEKPGISDDGVFISWPGFRPTSGFGIYGDLTLGPIKIAGISQDGALDPGETWNDADDDNVFDVGEDMGIFEVASSLAPFSLTSRVAGNQRADSGASRYRSAFLATGPSPDGIALGPLGLYASELDRSQSASSPRITPPSLVAQVGETFGDLPGIVTDLAIHDAINEAGQLAFWVETDQTSAVAVARIPLELDRWWFSKNAGRVPVVLSAWIDTPGTQNFEVTFESNSKWTLVNEIPTLGAATLMLDSPALAAPVQHSLTRTLGAGGASIAQVSLDFPTAGPYTIRIDGFTAQGFATVERIQFLLRPPFSSSLILNASFISDHNETMHGATFSVQVPGESPQVLGDVDALVDTFAPLLYFDSMDERYAQPYDPGEILYDPALFRGPITGDSRQAASLEPLSTGTPTGASNVYASVLRRSEVDPAHAGADELAISYWIHFPRSNWKEHNGANTHEGDWEGLTVFLSDIDPSQTETWEPSRVAYGQHVRALRGVIPDIGRMRTDGGQAVRWNDANRTGARAHAFVGLGAHALWSEAGQHDLFALGFQLFFPELHRGQAQFDLQPGDVRYVGRAHDAATPDWLRFPGTWGDASSMIPGAAAPSGPAFIASGFRKGQRWLDPWTWADAFSTEDPNDGLLTSGGSFSRTIDLPTIARHIEVEYEFLTTGEDILEVRINGVTQALIPASSAPTGVQTTPPIDVLSLAGQAITIEFALVPGSGSAAQVVIDSIEVATLPFPELSIASLSLTPGAGMGGGGPLFPGDPIDLAHDLSNTGHFELLPEQEFDLAFYLSTDALLDPGDFAVHTERITTQMDISAAIAIAASTTIPFGTDPGIYRLLAQVDAADEVFEVDESDNVFASSATIEVPEPSTHIMLVAGALALIALRKRRQ